MFGLLTLCFHRSCYSKATTANERRVLQRVPAFCTQDASRSSAAARRKPTSSLIPGVQSQHRHYHWNYGYLKTAVLRNKIIYQQNFTHQANLTLTNTQMNIFRATQLRTRACIQICLQIPQDLLMPSTHFKIIPNIPIQQLCLPFRSPPDALTEPQVTAAGPGPRPLRARGHLASQPNPTIPDASADVHISVNFVPLEIRKVQLLTPLTAAQTQKTCRALFMGTDQFLKTQ